MQKRCLKCGIMIDVPDMDTLNPDNRANVVCPQCGESYQYHMGQLKRPRPQYDLGMPENRIEKRKYAPIQNPGTADGSSASRSQESGATDANVSPSASSSESSSASSSDPGSGVSSDSGNSESQRSRGSKRDPFAVPGPEDKHRSFLRKLFGW